jgi:ferredoxin-NADP reductase
LCAIGVEVDGVRLWRCYSITSQPGAATLSITVKRVPGGKVSSHLHDAMQVGMTLLVLPPAGSSVHATRMRIYCCWPEAVASPALCHPASCLAAGQGRVRLVYVSQQSDSVIFGAALAALQARYPERLSLTLHLTASQGRLQAAGLRARLAAAMTRFYCAGRRACCKWRNAACCSWVCVRHPARAFWPPRRRLLRWQCGCSSVTLHGKQHATADTAVQC